jgi:membrane associated rhomboid family serine protease/pSer/pThr/pTyr-binding forkhead associated (FHA) protein
MSGLHDSGSALTAACLCGKWFTVPAAHVGRSGACPGCKRNLWIIAHKGTSAQGRTRAAIVVEKGPAREGEVFLLFGEEPVSVGKLPSEDIQLVGARVSRSHFRLIPSGKAWRVEDNKSTNGLFVNGERVTERNLRDGDRLRAGEYELAFVAFSSKGHDSLIYELAEDPPDGPILSDGEVLERVSSLQLEREAVTAGAPKPDEPAIRCPCCGKELPARSKICVACGVDAKTGRSLLTAEDTHLDQVYEVAERFIWLCHWVVWFGFSPVASEAFGGKKPYFIRAVTLITVITSAVFLFYAYTNSTKMKSLRQWVLWSGDRDPTAEEIQFRYDFLAQGDPGAFFRARDRLAEDHPDWGTDQVALAAHKSLPPEQRYHGEYRPWQLITHAFLHSGFMHLIGNLVFLLVFGSRVNALIGNLATIVLYPILAVGAGVAHVLSTGNESPQGMVGASGAIMGLAGVYLVLFPLPKLHMAVWVGALFPLALPPLALWLGLPCILTPLFLLVFVAWLRWLASTGSFVRTRFFSVQGFWVVLFYIAFDVVHTAFGLESDTAHWAHLGGFIAGVIVGLFLLLTKLVNVRGGDIVSAVLGRRAWAFVGKPNRGPGMLQRLP